MATQDRDFKVKNGLQVGGPTNLVNYSSSSPSNPFIGQLWVDSDEDSAAADLSSYLTLTAASALYLNIEDAQNTYLLISASSDFLTENSANTLYDALGSASAAEFNAKAYADSLAPNYDSAGSASAAQTAAQNYADTQIFNLVDSAPDTLNTLNELAAALGDDANFATSTASALGDRLTLANASATYLTKVDASTTYLPISASANLGGGVRQLALLFLLLLYQLAHQYG